MESCRRGSSPVNRYRCRRSTRPLLRAVDRKTFGTTEKTCILKLQQTLRAKGIAPDCFSNLSGRSGETFEVLRWHSSMALPVLGPTSIELVYPHLPLHNIAISERQAQLWPAEEGNKRWQRRSGGRDCDQMGH